jgi:ectoine hydroxylase-related dioxygenase (phytanoyl-CoA dioxygenase family)
MNTLKEQELPIGIGSKAGFHEVVQRSPGRFDVPLDEAALEPIWGTQGSVAPDVPWMGLVRDVLGPDASPSFCGVVFSEPGSPAQQWHIDSPHEGSEHRPAHAVNVLVALADISIAAGPTEVARGTHLLTNHLQGPSNLDIDDLLYQTSAEITPQILRGGQKGEEGGVTAQHLEALAAGDCLIFDDRILHRGLANNSDHTRWVAYFSYMRPRLEEGGMDTHFEATRSLFG